MTKPTVIRVGICGCFDPYHGDLDGRGMKIEGHSFQLEEIRLPDETWHTASIKAHRCHFFIDRAETNSSELHVSLDTNDLVCSPSGRSEKCYFKNHPSMDRRKKPKTSLAMARQIRELIAEMSQRRRQAWLRRMAFPSPSDHRRK